MYGSEIDDQKMDHKLSSFVSEHTTEFVLVPKIVKVFHSEFSSVVPLYFWLTREGGRQARQIHANEKFRVVALFPRRPKFSPENDSRIYMTVNDGVRGAAILLQKRGVPAIAGWPLIKSFSQIDTEPKCVFVALNKNTEFQYSFDADKLDGKQPKMILESDTQLVQYVIEQSRVLNFEELLIAVRESRSPLGSQGFYGTHMFSSGYKPVFVLLRRSNQGQAFKETIW